MRAAPKARYVWTFVKPGPCRRVDSLTDLEAENLRHGLRELQSRFGSLRALADAMGMPYQSVRHAVVKNRHPSVAFAFRAARAARISVEELIGGEWPTRVWVCPTCGQRSQPGRQRRCSVR